jgi:hypothetical protein
VAAASGVGALVGGMVAGLATGEKDDSGDTERNGDVVAACMTAGMWGGFALGIMTTRDSAPDPSVGRPATGATSGASYVPWVAEGQLGLMAAGTW